METTRGIPSDIGYLKALIGAGFDGISSARQELGGRVLTPPLRSVVWTPAAVGATVGALGTRLTGNRKPSSIAVGGLVGSLAGMAAGLLWTSRHFAGSAARKASERVSATREAHWLALHPIDYA